MNFDLGKKLKELRNRKGVTQEQLAEHLKISGQAVSKWERSEGYPDIMLLPRIALYFGVTVDELLGVSEEQTREQVAEWQAQSRKFRHDGELQKDYELWNAAYELYPNHPDVKEAYIDALYYREDGESKEKAVRLAKELLAESTDQSKRTGAIVNLVLLLSQTDRTDEAKEYADMAAPLLACRELLYGECLHGEERVRHAQNLICRLNDCIAEEVYTLAELSGSADEKILYYRYVLDLYRRLFPDGNYGFFHCRMHEYSEKLARQYAVKEAWDECLRCLAEAADHAAAFDRRTIAAPYTSFLTNHITDDPSGDFKSETTNECEELLASLNAACYDQIRTEPEFIRIISRLKPNSKSSIV